MCNYPWSEDNEGWRDREKGCVFTVRRKDGSLERRKRIVHGFRSKRRSGGTAAAPDAVLVPRARRNRMHTPHGVIVPRTERAETGGGGGERRERKRKRIEAGRNSNGADLGEQTDWNVLRGLVPKHPSLSLSSFFSLKVLWITTDGYVFEGCRTFCLTFTFYLA